MRPIAIAIRSLTIEPSSDSTRIDRRIPAVLRIKDWLRGVLPDRAYRLVARAYRKLQAGLAFFKSLKRC